MCPHYQSWSRKSLLPCTVQYHAIFMLPFGRQGRWKLRWLSTFRALRQIYLLAFDLHVWRLSLAVTRTLKTIIDNTIHHLNYWPATFAAIKARGSENLVRLRVSPLHASDLIRLRVSPLSASELVRLRVSPLHASDLIRLRVSPWPASELVRLRVSPLPASYLLLDLLPRASI